VNFDVVVVGLGSMDSFACMGLARRGASGARVRPFLSHRTARIPTGRRGSAASGGVRHWVDDQSSARARQRLGKFLLRHGWQRPKESMENWAQKHMAWIRSQVHVVEQYVEASVASRQAITQGDDAGFVAEVAAVGADGKADGRQLRGKSAAVLFVTGCGHYMRARLGESLNDMSAVDSSASGHQRYTAIQAKQFRRRHARQSASMAATRRSVNISLTRTGANRAMALS
jgi:hypothetical protein